MSLIVLLSLLTFGCSTSPFWGGDCRTQCERQYTWCANRCWGDAREATPVASCTDSCQQRHTACINKCEDEVESAEEADEEKKEETNETETKGSNL